MLGTTSRVAVLALALLASGCGLVPLGHDFGSSHETRVPPEGLAHRTPLVAIPGPSSLDSVQRFFPGARALALPQPDRRFGGSYYPTDDSPEALEAVARWRADPRLRRKGELLLRGCRCME